MNGLVSSFENLQSQLSSFLFFISTRYFIHQCTFFCFIRFNNRLKLLTEYKCRSFRNFSVENEFSIFSLGTPTSLHGRDDSRVTVYLHAYRRGSPNKRVVLRKSRGWILGFALGPGGWLFWRHGVAPRFTELCNVKVLWGWAFRFRGDLLPLWSLCGKLNVHGTTLGHRYHSGHESRLSQYFSRYQPPRCP